MLVKKFGAFDPKKNNRKDQWGPHGVLMGPHGVSMGHSEVEAAPPPPPTQVKLIRRFKNTYLESASLIYLATKEAAVVWD